MAVYTYFKVVGAYYFFCILQTTKSSININLMTNDNSDYTQHLSKLSSTTINPSLNLLSQDDPRLIDIIKNRYLYPPSEDVYNLSATDPNLEGQFGQARYIADHLFMVRIILKILRY